MALNESPPAPPDAPPSWEVLRIQIRSVLGFVRSELQKPELSWIPGRDGIRDIDIKPYVKVLQDLRRPPFTGIVTTFLHAFLYLNETSMLGRNASLTHLDHLELKLDSWNRKDSHHLTETGQAQLIQLLNLFEDATLKFKMYADDFHIFHHRVPPLLERLEPFIDHPQFGVYAVWLRDYLNQHAYPIYPISSIFFSDKFPERMKAFLKVMWDSKRALIQIAQRSFLAPPSPTPSAAPRPRRPVDPSRPLGELFSLRRQVRELNDRLSRVTAERDVLQTRNTQLEAENSVLKAQLATARRASSGPNSPLARELVKVDRGPLSAGNFDPDAVMQLWAKHSGDEDRFRRALDRLISRTTHTDRKVEVTGPGAEQIVANIETTLKAQFEARSRVVEELMAQLKQDGAITDQWKYTKAP